MHEQTFTHMRTNLYSILYPPMIRSLTALSGALAKAEEHARARKTERLDFEGALLNDRLIFDQFPLVRQVQIATDNAKNSIKRLTGAEVPVFDDNERTFAELQDRITRTLELLRAVKPEAISASEEVRVALPYWDGKSLSGFEYATMHLLPNFYFHVTTAYDIIRKNGVRIGKADYIGELPLT